MAKLKRQTPSGYLNDHSDAEAKGQGDVRPNWLDFFVKRYTDIIDSHAVAFQTFGHEHVDTFRLSGAHSVTPRYSCTHGLYATDPILLHPRPICYRFFFRRPHCRPPTRATTRLCACGILRRPR